MSTKHGIGARQLSFRTTRKLLSRRLRVSFGRGAMRRLSRSSGRRARHLRRTSSARSARRTCTTIWSERSLNNEIGLPLTLLRLEPETKIVVAEMGMRGLGQISRALRCRQAGRSSSSRTSAPSTSSCSEPSNESRTQTRRRSRPCRRAGSRWFPPLHPSSSLISHEVTSRCVASDPRDVGVRRRTSSIPGQRGERRAGTAVHAAPPGGEHAGGAPRIRRSRSPSGACGARSTRHRALAVEGRRAAASRWRARRQRRVQREPRLDARRLSSISPSVRARGVVSRSWERWPSSGASSDDFHRGIGQLARDLDIEVIGVGEPARAYEPAAWVASADEVVEVARVFLSPAGRRRAREGLARGRARRHRRGDHEHRRGMVPVLIAGLLAMVAAVVIGPKFIERLRARNLGQQIRAEGPATHGVKQGTPTMGGVLIVGSSVIPVPPPLPVHDRGADRALRHRSAARRSASQTTT